MHFKFSKKKKKKKTDSRRSVLVSNLFKFSLESVFFFKVSAVPYVWYTTYVRSGYYFMHSSIIIFKVRVGFGLEFIGYYFLSSIIFIQSSDQLPVSIFFLTLFRIIFLRPLYLYSTGPNPQKTHLKSKGVAPFN